MNTTLESDLKRLQLLAYNRFEWGSTLLRKFHELPGKIKSHPDFLLLELDAVGWIEIDALHLPP